VLTREGARVAIAFVLYLVFLRLWIWSGLAQAYDSLVMALASRIFLPTQHFPIVPTLENISLRDLDFAVVFSLSLFVVSTRIPWKQRLERFSLILLVLYMIHVLAVVLQVKVNSALDLNRQYDLLILLPWEFKVVERARYLLYDFGLQATPFVLLLLTAAWNSGLKLPARARQPAAIKRRLQITTACLLVALVAVLFWSRWREAHPLHVGAHATLGRIYLEHDNLDGAEKQYRIAVAGSTEDPLVFYNLAMITSRSGSRREAIDALEQGLQVTSDPEWITRFDQALSGLEERRP